jgi:hypothetical protein
LRTALFVWSETFVQVHRLLLLSSVSFFRSLLQSVSRINPCSQWLFFLVLLKKYQWFRFIVLIVESFQWFDDVNVFSQIKILRIE